MGKSPRNDKFNFELSPYNFATIAQLFSFHCFIYVISASDTELLSGASSTCHLVNFCPQLKTMHILDEALPDEVEQTIKRAVKSRNPCFGIHHDTDEQQLQQTNFHKLSIAGKQLDCISLLTIPTNYISEDFSGCLLVFCKTANLEKIKQDWPLNSERYLSELAYLIQVIHVNLISSIISLSPRESECLSLLAGGLRPGEIAASLNVGYRSVDKFINSARKKLKGNTRDHTIARAISYKLV